MSPVKAMGTLKGNNGCTVTAGPLQMTSLTCTPLETTMIKDVQLKRAAEQAEREGSERPLVMQQLRTKIQLDRLRHGKGELTVSFDQPQKYELTEEEKEKLEKRKIRNRQAAKKSRVKKKQQHSHLQKRNKKLKEKNSSLRTQLNTLYDVVSNLQEAIHQVRNCGKGTSSSASVYLPMMPVRSPPEQSLHFLPQGRAAAPAAAAATGLQPALSGPAMGSLRSFAPVSSQGLSRGQHFVIKGNQLIPVLHGSASSTRSSIPYQAVSTSLLSSDRSPQRCSGDLTNTITGSDSGRGRSLEGEGHMVTEELSSLPPKVIPEDIKVIPGPEAGESEFYGGVPSTQPILTNATYRDLAADWKFMAAGILSAGPSMEQNLPVIAAEPEPTTMSLEQMLKDWSNEQEEEAEKEDEDDDVVMTAIYKPGMPLVPASSTDHTLLSFSSPASLSSSSSSSSPILGSVMQLLTRGP